MKKLLLGLLAIAASVPTFSQTVNLPETLITINSDYLSSINMEDPQNYVAKLEQALLNYDHSELSKLYDDKNDLYNVSFKLPEGQIIATFNKKGKIIKTYETYYNVRLPLVVMQTISENYPNYGIIEDVYLIKYHNDKPVLKQEYKIKLKNKSSIISVKTNENGDFI